MNIQSYASLRLKKKKKSKMLGQKEPKEPKGKNKNMEIFRYVCKFTVLDLRCLKSANYIFFYEGLLEYS